MDDKADQDHSQTMPFEKFDLEKLTQERHAAIAKSIRTINADELKKIGEELFPMAGDPWGELYYQFIGNNQTATFHHAVTNDGVHLVYCRDRDKGIWFKPGSGKGPLNERGRVVMKEMIEKR